MNGHFKHVLSLVLLFGLVASGCSKAEPVAKEDIPPVRTQVVSLNAEGTPVTYPGEVVGRNESHLSFQVGGKITKRYVEVGDAVNAGDVLMEIDTIDLQQDVTTQKASVEAIEATLRLHEDNLKRYKQLLDNGAISKAEVDSLQTTRDATAAQLEQAKSQLERMRNQVNYGVLVAGANGIVSHISGEVGQVVNPNHPGEDVITLVLDNEREVAIDVPERQLADIQKTGKINVSFWALPNVTLAGTIRDIAPMADKATRTYKVKISVPALPAEVKYGMTATVSIYPANPVARFTVPLSSLYQRSNDASVWVVQGHSVSLRPVKVGNVLDGKVEIVGGLKDGEIIVTAGVHKLREGQTVRVNAGGGQ
ncbi:efflux RND transporter periplasmic adaptor subunit [Heliobacterium gestii]|uniref:Efflux RND transporter periplasmic adaptor subunit n=1 Tax=Heliomicrobium gestii TaxID=2699 RepID=A0A845LHE7_HELGE|nr:efflux RND transporter periplasmic adaptor subunit [Heliomicrobium gestii]MBM7866318.1 RND family efflux transporter MFP subunit [Heliomicrobium gestii]MZP42893.1 efflux RND transporter periplasmic adaptor subunit [Heliomicrobium gestii]